MRDELEVKLVEKYPEIFRDRKGNIMKSAMPWGFEIGDGWYDIIDVLCSMISRDVNMLKHDVREISNQLAQKNKEHWNDWAVSYYTEELLEDSKKKLQDALTNLPYATQVKEKFGLLRFYVSYATEQHHEFIRMAEYLSERTCEVCGKMGSHTYFMGWSKTLCRDHAIEHYGLKDVEEYEKNV